MKVKTVSLTQLLTSIVVMTLVLPALAPPVAGQTPAQVSWTSPGDGTTVSGVVMMELDFFSQNGSLDYQITLDGVMIFASTNESSGTFTFSWDSETTSDGSHTLEATVTGSNSSDSSAITIFVANNNTPPTITVNSPQVGSTIAGTHTMDIVAVDSEGDTMSVILAIDGQTVHSQSHSGGSLLYSWDTAQYTDGNHTLDVTASDNSSTTSASVRFQISNSNNQPPTITWSSPAAGSTVSGSQALAFVAVDPEGDTMAYDLHLDGVQIATGTMTNGTAPDLILDTTQYSDGPHTFTVVVTDTHGNSVTLTVAVDFSNGNPGASPGNTAPVVTLTGPNPMTGRTTFTMQLDDNDGDLLYYNITTGNGTWVVGGSASANTTVTAIWHSTQVPDGTYAFVLEVSDGQTTTSATFTSIVNNTAGRSGNSSNNTPGFTTPMVVGAIVVGSLLAFFRRRDCIRVSFQTQIG